jgi:hypothetical protein
VTRLSTVETSDSYEGFPPQPSWAHYTFDTRQECGQIRRSAHNRKRHLSSHRDNCLTGSSQEYQGRPMEEDEEPIWAVGARKIEVNDLVLVRLDHVSKNNWQPQLQLHPLHRS